MLLISVIGIVLFGAAGVCSVFARKRPLREQPPERAGDVAADLARLNEVLGTGCRPDTLPAPAATEFSQDRKP